MSAATRVDDPTIADSAPLWRRIPPTHIRVDRETGEARASDSAYRTQQMSVHIASLTSIQTVLAKYPTHRVAEFRAGDARAVGCIVVRDRLEDDPSHALVCRKDDPAKSLTMRQAREIANRAQWASLRAS